jgi:hypothetical protein
MQIKNSPIVQKPFAADETFCHRRRRRSIQETNRAGARGSGSRSKPWRWGFSLVTNQLEQVLLHDRESERGNQLINPHAADLCLKEELSDRHLIKG